MSRQTKRYAKLRSLKRGFNQPTPKRESDWKLTADAIEQACSSPLKSTATPKQLMRLKTEKKAFANRRRERAPYKNRVRRSSAKNGTVIPKNKSHWYREKIKCSYGCRTGPDIFISDRALFCANIRVWIDKFWIHKCLLHCLWRWLLFCCIAFILCQWRHSLHWKYFSCSFNFFWE